MKGKREVQYPNGMSKLTESFQIKGTKVISFENLNFH